MIRPRFITLMAWLFIASGVIGLLSGLVLLGSEGALQMMGELGVPVGISMGMTLGSSVVYLICGIGMLKALNWSRHLLVLLMVPTLLVGLVYSPYKLAMIPSVIVMFLMLWPLYRPLAHRFFTHQLSEADINHINQPKSQQGIGTVRKVFAITLYVVSGFIIYMLCFASFVDAGGVNILPDMLRQFALPFVVAHGFAIILFNTPARWLGSGITFLVGPLFTLFILSIALYYPLPEAYADIDLKSQFSNVALGIPVLLVLLLVGTIQLVIGILQMRTNASKVAAP